MTPVDVDLLETNWTQLSNDAGQRQSNEGYHPSNEGYHVSQQFVTNRRLEDIDNDCRISHTRMKSKTSRCLL